MLEVSGQPCSTVKARILCKYGDKKFKTDSILNYYHAHINIETVSFFLLYRLSPSARLQQEDKDLDKLASYKEVRCCSDKEWAVLFCIDAAFGRHECTARLGLHTAILTS